MSDLPLAFVAKKLLTALVLPPVGLVLLVLLGWRLASRPVRPWPRMGKGMIGLGLLSLVLLSLPVVSDALLRAQERYPAVTAETLQQAEAIVILGGGMYYNAPEYGQDVVNHWSLERVRYGAYVQRQQPLPILVTGGAPSGGRPEAEAMRDVLVQEFRGQVQWVENASLDTAENARYSARLLHASGVKTIALITHGWHLTRAVPLFEREGLTVIPAPTGFTTSSSLWLFRWLPSAAAFEDSSIALREALGRLVLR